MCAIPLADSCRYITTNLDFHSQFDSRDHLDRAADQLSTCKNSNGTFDGFSWPSFPASLPAPMLTKLLDRSLPEGIVLAVI
jgi:hypothetical protein